MPPTPPKDRLAAARAARSRAYEQRLAGILRARGWTVFCGSPFTTERPVIAGTVDYEKDEIVFRVVQP